MLVPDEALGALALEAFLRVGGGEGGNAGVRDRSRVAAGNGRQMGLEARLAVGRDPLDAAIGGDALLKAAVHQLGVVALLLHLRWGEGCGVRGRGRGRVRVQGQ